MKRRRNRPAVNLHGRRLEDLPDLCTPEEARQFLQVGKNTIYALVREGRFESRRYGAQIRIVKSSLVE
jgi:excisionase family DNA binding protein